MSPELPRPHSRFHSVTHERNYTHKSSLSISLSYNLRRLKLRSAGLLVVLAWQRRRIRTMPRSSPLPHPQFFLNKRAT